MRGGVLSVFDVSTFYVSVARRSLVLALGLCLPAIGCGEKSTATKPEAEAKPATTSATAGMSHAESTPLLNPVTEHRDAGGDRYANAPRYPSAAAQYPTTQTITDPVVQPAGYRAVAPASTAAQTQVMMQTPGLKEPREEEFMPGVEDLQLFEQPNVDSYGRTAQQPQGWISSAEMLNWKVGQRPRTSPLPHSP